MEKETEIETRLNEEATAGSLSKGELDVLINDKTNIEANDTNQEITDIKTNLDINSANGIIENGEKDVQMSKAKIYRTLVVYSFAFVLLFSASGSFASIQSTVNIEAGLGTTGLATLYITMVTTNLFVTTITLPKLSYKRMTILTMVTYACFVATGFYSNWYTYIPACVLIGFGAAHLWSAQQGYITQLAKMYAKQNNAKYEDALTLFFGIFYGLFYTSCIWGNLCSSLVFGNLKEEDFNNSIDVGDLCGAQFCATDAQDDNGTYIEQPDQHQVYVFTGFCVTVACLAVISIIILMTNVPAPKSITNYSVCCQIQKVVRLILTSRDQHLLITVTILGGMTQAFVTGDFTVAFVSCPYGVGKIGFVLITYGVCCSVCSFAVAKISKFTGSLLLFFIGIGMQTAAALTMLLWSPSHSQPAIVYIIAVMWGVGDAVLQPLTSALYSVYFKDNLETALSSYRVLNSIGWALSFSYSSWLCTDKKIYILLSFLCISMMCVFILSCKHKKDI